MILDNKVYDSILKKLRKDENTFNGFVKLVAPINVAQVKSVERHSKGFVSTNVQSITEEMVLQQIDEILNKKRPYGQHGKKLPRLVKKYGVLLPDGARAKLLNMITTPMNNFYTYAKKELIEQLVPWIESEDQAIKVINEHHGLLKVNTLEALLSKVANGIEHEALALFRDRSLPFIARQIQALDLNVAENKYRAVNAVAKAPRLLQYLNITLHITLDDFKQLPPARRFDFIQYCYGPLLGRFNEYSKNWWPRNITKDHITKAKTHKLYSQIKVDKISRDDMKHLLFAISVRKYEEMAAWYERYDAYLKKA